jgi:hypothetical protein
MRSSEINETPAARPPLTDPIHPPRAAVCDPLAAARATVRSEDAARALERAARTLEAGE